LVAVLVFLLVIAAVVALKGGEELGEIHLAAADAEARRIDYAAQAGLQHAVWQARNNSCSGDFTIPATAIGPDTYTASTTGGGSHTGYTLFADQDAWIRSDNPTATGGLDQHIRFQGGNIEQALYRFNLSTLPAGARIQSAVAWFYLELTKEHPEGPLTVHRVTADWTEAGATWDGLNGNIETAALGMIPAQAIGGVWVQVNLTAQVQAWVNGQPNYGIMLGTTAEGIHSEYKSREDGSTPPRLEVVAGAGQSSPVSIQATGTLANGYTRTLSRPIAPAYQPPSTVTLQLGADAGEDALLDSFYANRNYGGANYLQVNDNGTNWQQYPLLRFDLAGLPRGAYVRSAQLELRLQDLVAPGTATVHQVTHSWVEGTKSGGGTADGATWFRHDGVNAWTSAGGDYNAAAVAETTINGSETWVGWDIAPLVERWLAGEPNYGLLIKPNNGLREAEFDSQEETTAGVQPKLTITYACECGSACMRPQGSGNLLMVIGSSPFNPAPEDISIRDYLEGWGYTVTFIQDDDSQSNFNAGVAANDAVFISESVTGNNVGTKLTNSPIGVVSTEGNLNDELGISTARGTPVGDTIDVVDNAHYITRIFPAAPLQFKTVDTELASVGGTVSPEAQVLANVGGAGGLVALDAGALSFGGGPVAGRRVLVPAGDANVSWDYLTNIGQLVIQRAIAWAMGANDSSIGNVLLVVVNPSSLTAQEDAKKLLMESWDFSVNLIDESDSQANFDAAIANNDVAYITEDINSSNLGTKLRNATIGVVNEEGEQVDELGFSADKLFKSRHEIDVIDNSHYITETFATGLLTFTSSDQSVHMLVSQIAPGLQTLGESNNVGGQWEPSLATLDAGDDLSGGGTAAGRRVELPWGGGTFNINLLNDDGRTIMQRALEWGAGVATVTGPIAHWKLDEGSGPTAFDSVGGNDATLNGDATWTIGTIDGALDFDGSGDYVITNSNFTPPPVGTVTFWMQVSGSPASHGRILGLDDEWEIRHVTTGTPDGIPYGLVFDLGLSGVNTEFVTTTTIDVPGRWYHIAAAYDTTNDAYAVYIDGVPHKSGTYPTALAVPAANLLSLGTRTGSTDYFDGVLDDVRIYDKFLSAAEIAELGAGGGPGPQTVLLVVADAASPSSRSAGRRDLIESWGNTVTLIDDGDSQTNFDTAMAANDVVYVTDTVSGPTLLDKVTNTTTPVVNEKGSKLGNFGFSSGESGTVNASTFSKTDALHYISEPFAGNPVTIFTSSMTMSVPSGTLAPDLQNVGEVSGTLALVTLEDGATLWNGGSAPARRAHVPLGGAEVTQLTDDGKTLMRRSIDWAAGEGGGGGGGGCTDSVADDFETGDYAGSTGTLPWLGPWQEINEDGNHSNGDERVQNESGDKSVRVRDNDGGGEGIERQADLSTYSGGTLSLEYRRQNLDDADDYVTIDVWNTGTSSWDELDRIAGGGTDAAYQSISHDITAYLGTNTRIRFLTSPNMGGTDNVFFDNVEICVSN